MLDRDFFERNAEIVAPDLIGSFLFTTIDSNRVGGMIIETEAYSVEDPAAHCHPQATKKCRNQSDAMLLQGGHAYVHFDRGLPCLNLTCDREGFGSAVLVRAILPCEGIDVMTNRRAAHPAADKKIKFREGSYQRRLCNGPGKVGEALGIVAGLNKASLFRMPFELRPKQTLSGLFNGPRVGVPRATETAWRWGHKEFSEWLSTPFTN